METNTHSGPGITVWTSLNLVGIADILPRLQRLCGVDPAIAVAARQAVDAFEGRAGAMRTLADGRHGASQPT